jgi:hypothetical protein
MNNPPKEVLEELKRRLEIYATKMKDAVANHVLKNRLATNEKLKDSEK